MRNKSPAQIGGIIFFLALISFAILIGKAITSHPPLLVLGLIGGIIIALITLVNTDLALIIIIFSMLLSPEIPLAHVPQRAVVIRLDDILIAFMFFTWLAKMAINKQLGLLKTTPINKPLAIYVFIYLLSTFWGIFQDRVLPLQGLFYILKYTEYFAIFFIFTNNIRSLHQSKKFIFCFLLTSIFVSIYALSTRGYYGRAAAPFEGEVGEPNTLAGYLVLVASLTIGQLIYCKSNLYRLFLFSVILLAVPTLIFTLSRGGYTAFIVMYIAIIILAKKGKIALIGILLVAVLLILGGSILPHIVKERIQATFGGMEEFTFLGQSFSLESSAAQRIIVWQWIFQKWQKHPFLGWGVTGLGLVDNQYALLLGEVGLIGMVAFIWLIFAIIRNSLKIAKAIELEELKGITIGFIGGLAGLLIQSFTGNIFIIVRIMEPFWFLTAIVMMLPQISASSFEDIE